MSARAKFSNPPTAAELESKMKFIAWLVTRHPQHLWLFERFELEIEKAKKREATMARARELAGGSR